MPVSIQIQITACVTKIVAAEPASVLDVGCGFGKWGYLCREYLDAFNGRWRPEDWTTRIDGIEFFEPYILDHQRALYSNITIGDIRDLCKTCDEYDVIIAGDVIEHMHKDEAEEVVETLYAKARKLLIVNIPLGKGWDHPAQYGNPAELHRSEWYKEDFDGYAIESETYRLPAGIDYGSFYCAKDMEPDVRVAGFGNAALFYGKQGDTTNALRYLERAQRVEAQSLESTLLLVDTMIQLGKVEMAQERLQWAIGKLPENGMLRVFLAKLLHARGQKDEAVRALQEAAALDNLDADIQQELDGIMAAWGLA
mgnify:CR=1 FL=1